MMRQIGIAAIVLIAVITVWYKQRSAEKLAQEPQAVAQPVSQKRMVVIQKPVRIARDRPSRERGPRPGDSR